MKLFVYGTLKKGFYNYGWLKDSKFLSDYTIPDFTLYDTGYGYPAAAEKENHIVEGELYEIDSETYKNIRSMEIGAGYEEQTLLGDIKLFIYTQNRIDTLYNKKEIGKRWN